MSIAHPAPTRVITQDVCARFIMISQADRLVISNVITEFTMVMYQAAPARNTVGSQAAPAPTKGMSDAAPEPFIGQLQCRSGGKPGDVADRSGTPSWSCLTSLPQLPWRYFRPLGDPLWSCSTPIGHHCLVKSQATPAPLIVMFRAPVHLVLMSQSDPHPFWSGPGPLRHKHLACPLPLRHIPY